MHTETRPSKFCCVWLGITFAVLLLPPLFLRELNCGEALNALTARALLWAGNPAALPAAAEGCPGVPWLMALLGAVLPFHTWTVRLAGVIPALGLAAICAAMARRGPGVHVTSVAAAATLTSAAAICWAPNGGGSMLFAFLVNAAWYTWYVLGRERRRWLYAWFLSYLIVGLAVLCGGWCGVIFFYVPLVFLRGPLKVWRRLVHRDHLVALLLAALLGGLWFGLSPGPRWPPFLLPGAAGWPWAGSYGWRLLLLPWVAVVCWFPWLFLGWPAFCAAFSPLESDPVLCRFLRTICVSLFLVLWLFPLGGPAALLPLSGPLAILTAHHYDLLIRRHGRQLRLLPLVLARATVVGTVLLILVLAGLQLLGWSAHLPPGFQAVVVVAGVAAALVAVKACNILARKSVWLSTAITMAIFSLVVSTALAISGRARGQSRRADAASLSRNLPVHALVYSTLDEGQCPVLWFYLGHPVRRLAKAADLPVDAGEIYVVGGYRPPVAPGRKWVAVSDTVTIDGNAMRTWMGVRR